MVYWRWTETATSPIGSEFENNSLSCVSFPNLTCVTTYAEFVQLRYNYRLYPAPGQRAALARAFGCARVVFNDGLRARQKARQAGQPYITDVELSARLTAAKAAPERAWLGDVSAVVLQQAQFHGPKVEAGLFALYQAAVTALAS